MQHRSAHAWLPAALSLSFAGGCQVIAIDHSAELEARATTLAEAYCAAYQACDCAPLATDAVHPDPAQCVSEQKTRLIAAFEQAEEYDLEFDEGCMNQLLSRYEQLGCESYASLQIELGNPTLAENFGCALYHGDEVDGICESVPGTSWDECAAGLMCSDQGTCGPVLSSAAAGESCTFNSSEYSLDCEAGLYCDQSVGCAPFSSTADPCVAGGEPRCAPDHHCELLSDDAVEGTCQPLWTAGEACNPMTNSTCLGWCLELEDADDPTAGACVDIPAVCLHAELQPPIARG